MSTYPRDEFDNIPESSSRQGVHRTAGAPAGRGLGPLIAFAVVALVIGLAAFLILPKLFTTPSPTPVANSAAQHSSSSPASTSTQAPSTSSAPAPASSTAPAAPTTQAPVADKKIPVGVFNASGVTGLANKVSTQLKSLGWTVSQAGNWSGAAQSTSAVYYQSAAQQATAEAVAKDLGIAKVVQATDAALPLMVVLGPGAQ
ncbi:LytR C-terminal domain-containing protein [Psychromicrobium xiongbiense]|uniref:LytR C-terminal domain-containing protein n=1 Tax=Psychromicrobium xiongbiense TaxID=3051184 RepID=UPI0025559309|nr:LytR C-terminal domain-containing protein [Psychromicrobium sp. YIM S02556]